ncbi:shikimate kinase [Pyrococcus kukulkanii]|uniref:shikimate kinase n=1 Tax=Pyrococcus kukulkanii TaxID=1609559 RepID=UPI00356464A4
MRGLGRASSAVTVINAFATGKGAAIGIDLWTEAEVKLKDSGIEAEITVNGKRIHDLRLVNAIVDVFREYTGEEFGLYVKVTSEIPIGKGLKSSSAAANALASALTNALNLSIPDIKLVKLGVEAAKRAGVTITGAFDDACASYFGGLCITDNYKMELLVRREVESLPVVVLVPRETVLTESLKEIDFTVLAPYVEEAFKLALNGEWEKALVINGLVYSAFLGYNPKPISEALRLGCIVGLSGKGPAMFGITEDPENLAEVWNRYGEVIVTELR